MKKNILQLTVVIGLILTGCTTGGKAPVETWEDFAEMSPTVDVPQHLAGVIFYRPANAVVGQAVNIYAGEEYVTSLLPNGYQQVALCPDNQRIHAEFAQQDPAYIRKHNVGQYYNLPINETVYFEVVPDAQYGVALQPVDASIGAQAIVNLARQNHTLPRLDRKATCGTQRLKQYTLEASALFYFDKSDYANMLPKGRAEIQAMVQDMQQYMEQVSNIEVVGHTDPDGSHEYNDALSLKRAQTVKQAMVANGVDATIISTQGRGERELVVSDCEKIYPNNRSERLACNQPNRRVEINLYGTQKIYVEQQ